MWSRQAILFACILLLRGGLAVAGDEEGCLFCHRLDLVRASPGSEGSDLRVWEPPGGIHGSLHCSDCHLDARIAPHPSPPGPASCIGECHGSAEGAAASHRRASFGGAIESHRKLSTPRAPCMLCHRATDRPGEKEKIEARCGACHPGERDSMPRGVHARFFRPGTAEMCARCHVAHSEGEGPSRIACGGEGCHEKVTGSMRRVAGHGKKREGGTRDGKLPRAGVFLLIAAVGGVAGRLLSPPGKRAG